MTSDPFDALRRPSPSRRPRVDFAVALRRQLEQELAMSTTNDQLDVDVTHIPAMVHLGVADAGQGHAVLRPTLRLGSGDASSTEVTFGTTSTTR